MRADEVMEQPLARNVTPQPFHPSTPEVVSSTKSLTLEEAIQLYKTVGNRKSYLFHWLYDIYSKVTLPCISPEYREILALDKTKLAIFDVMADDLADNCSSRNAAALDELLEIPWRKNDSENKYILAGKRLWEDCMNSVTDYPRFKEFERIFYFDLRQVVSGMEYGYLANSAEMGNPIDNWVHVPHGCMVILHCDLDLMCSPGFDMADLGNMRTLFHLAQRVAHIGNLLNTYPKELVEKDLSCPLIARAIRMGLVKEEELGDESALDKVKGLESVFKKQAEVCIRRMEKCEKEVRSVNMSGFSITLSKILEKFIARPQYWKLAS